MKGYNEFKILKQPPMEIWIEVDGERIKVQINHDIMKKILTKGKFTINHDRP